MYKNPQFEEKDFEKIIAFMKAHSFITLIGYDNGYPVATQTPVYIQQDENGMKIIGHVMKKSDHYLAYAKNENVLVLFTGAHAYISASVYENPAAASTWNYSSVHVKGKIKLLDQDGTRAVIKHLTNSFEDPETSPAAFHKMTDDYIDRHLKAISGFEIVVEDVASVFKLSQNHALTNREKIVENLSKSDDHEAIAVANLMRENL